MTTDRDLQEIFDPRTIRAQSRRIFDLCKVGETNFALEWEKLPALADYVVAVVKANYPSLEIPFHSRHGHLKAGNVNRILDLEQRLSGQSSLIIAKRKLELVLVSVLLDAGAGETWKYLGNGKEYNRSEGLAVASYDAFVSGLFSSNPQDPCGADAVGLKNVTKEKLEKAFQVSPTNPLLGVEGRVHLLNSLGKVLEVNKKSFPQQRMGDALDHFLSVKPVSALRVLDFVLQEFSSIWPSRLKWKEKDLGDVWLYSKFGSAPAKESLIPFHKLSQWLTYSLLMPILELGETVVDVEKLTGLPEYRNGGLFLDFGVLSLRDPRNLSKEHEPGSDLIIEWRALTVCLLDETAALVRAKLGKTEADFPLAKILEGGTWHAGRKIAKEKRADGAPPLKIKSDGTVF